jgi:hypothetical protein
MLDSPRWPKVKIGGQCVGVYTSHTKLAGACIWGSAAGFIVLLYILYYLFHVGRIDYDVFYKTVILYVVSSIFLMFCAIFSRVDALYLSFLRAGRRLSGEQFALILSSIYGGSLILFGVGFCFVAPDFPELVRQFADYGLIKRLVGAFSMAPLLLSLVALLVSNVLAIYRGVRICKRKNDSRII